MRLRLLVTGLLVALALLGVAISQAEVIQRDGLRVKFNAGFDPHVLPRDRPAPVRIHVQGSVATTDGSHPPPLSWLEVELNRNGRLTTKGLPVCSARVLQSTTTTQARTRCRRAVVGRGAFRAEVELGGEVSARGKIIAFNSRIHGSPALLLHFFARAPVRFTLVVPLKISHRGRGEFGTLLRTRVPRLAAGLGSVTRFDLTLGRRYSAGGGRRSYLSASCSAPRGLRRAVFPFARARFRFESHPEISSKLAGSCLVRG